MDHLTHLTQQEKRMEAQDSPASTASGPVLDDPLMPSVREVNVAQLMLPLLALPAQARTGQNTVPVLAVGMKRSAADADLDADVVHDARRSKVSHATELD